MKNLTALSAFVAALCIIAPNASAAGKQKGQTVAAKATGNTLGAKVEEGPRAGRMSPSSAKDASKETSSVPPSSKTPSIEVSKDEPKAEGAPDSKSPKLVSVTVKSDYPNSRLETFVDDKLTTVCELPCTKALEVGKLYRVDGPGMITSSVFTPSEDTHSFNVKGGSQVANTTGIILLGVGSAVASAGLTLAQVGATERGDARMTYTTVALGTLAAASAALVAGVILWLVPSTKVEESKVKSAAKMALSLATTGGISF
jgi:hypothetical protein